MAGAGCGGILASCAEGIRLRQTKTNKDKWYDHDRNTYTYILYILYHILYILYYIIYVKDLLSIIMDLLSIIIDFFKHRDGFFKHHD